MSQFSNAQEFEFWLNNYIQQLDEPRYDNLGYVAGLLGIETIMHRCILHRWEKRLNIQTSDWAIKKMKTKWGTCNADARRIWLNLELAKKPIQCLEYILVHELVHLLERHHNDRFISIMNRHLPQWRAHRQLLNSEPLAHDTWSY